MNKEEKKIIEKQLEKDFDLAFDEAYDKFEEKLIEDEKHIADDDIVAFCFNKIDEWAYPEGWNEEIETPEDKRRQDFFSAMYNAYQQYFVEKYVDEVYQQYFVEKYVDLEENLEN